MDEHGKQKTDIRQIIKEVLEAAGTKKEFELSSIITKRCNDKYGPTVRAGAARRRFAPPQNKPRPRVTWTAAPPDAVPFSSPAQWQCVVGEDFKAAIRHETKSFLFLTSGKVNVLLVRRGCCARRVTRAARKTAHPRPPPRAVEDNMTPALL